MKEFIKLTGLGNNGFLFIKASSINGVIRRNGITRVFVNGDSFPYEVKEYPEDVITKIKELEESNETNETTIFGFLLK